MASGWPRARPCRWAPACLALAVLLLADRGCAVPTPLSLNVPVSGSVAANLADAYTLPAACSGQCAPQRALARASGGCAAALGRPCAARGSGSGARRRWAPLCARLGSRARRHAQVSGA